MFADGGAGEGGEEEEEEEEESGFVSVTGGSETVSVTVPETVDFARVNIIASQ